MFPIQKIASVMKRVLPPSAVISREAKQAVQACVCEFICFLTSEACDIRDESEEVDGDDGGGEGDPPVASASEKAARSLTSERILKAFCHLGFDKYSDVCQTYIERYRHHLNSAAVQEARPKKRQQTEAPVEESSSEVVVEKVCPMQSGTGCIVEDAPEDGSESTSSQRRSSASSAPAVSAVDSAVAMAASQLYSPLERARHVFNPPKSPNIHAIKSLRDASVEVRSAAAVPLAIRSLYKLSASGRDLSRLRLVASDCGVGASPRWLSFVGAAAFPRAGADAFPESDGVFISDCFNVVVLICKCRCRRRCRPCSFRVSACL